VRLLDFGIAKLNGRRANAGRRTPRRWADGALTLDYASPEQIRASPLARRAMCTAWRGQLRTAGEAKPYQLKRQSAAALEESRFASVDVRLASTAARPIRPARTPGRSRRDPQPRR